MSSSRAETQVDLLGIPVLVYSATRIRDHCRDEYGAVGAVIVGQLIDAKGKVVADKIKIDSDGNGDAGDDDRRDKRGHDDEDGSEVVREVAFQNIDANLEIEGKTKFKHEREDNDIKQELKLSTLLQIRFTELVWNLVKALLVLLP